MGNLFMTGMLAAQTARDSMEKNAQVRNMALENAALKTDAAEMRDQLERLCLLTQAMWELVSQKLGLTETNLEKAAQEIDLRDGIADGKMSAHPLRCPQCGRISNSKHKKCLYCGLLFEGSLFG